MWLFIKNLLLKRRPPGSQASRGATAAMTGVEDCAVRYRELYAHAPDMIFTHDLQGRMTSVNRAGEKLTGYEAREFCRLDWPQLVIPDHFPLVRTMLQRRLAGENVPPFEVEIASKSGGRVAMEINTWILHKDGQPIGFQGIARDVTGRRQAETDLRHSERRFKEFADLLPQTVFECDLQGGFTFVNQASYAIFGYTPEDFQQGLNVFQMTVPDEVERVKANMRAALAGRVSTGIEYIGRRKDGSLFPVLVFSTPLFHDQKPAGLRGILIDITEHRNLETQLRRSQKMESVGQLAAGIAHDFNNILTIVHGHASLLLTKPALPPSLVDSLSQIVSATRKATDLIRQLLAFSRKQILQPRPLDLNGVVTGISPMLPRLLGEHISMKVRCAPRLPVIRADAAMMEQVLMNLAVNARDAMPRGGRLTIATAVCDLDAAAAARHTEARPGCFAQLTVTDTGCGMDPQTLERLFEPFFTTKEPGKGTGLGLATVYGIVKQHEGWIEVESEAKRGSTFKIFLPALNETANKCSPPTRPAPESPMVQGKGETILLVEDEPAVRQMMAGVLRPCGYRILEASDGREALKVWHRESGAVDLLLTDMVMPAGLSGKELASQLRAHKAGIKVIYISGFSEDLLGLPAEWLGTDRFLPKPFHPRNLSKVVRECLDHH